MTVRFTHRRMSAGGTRHEHIARLYAVDAATGQPYDSTREQWHDFIVEGNSGYVRDSQGDMVYVRAMKTASGTKYVQTYADNTPKDNLLWLPLY